MPTATKKTRDAALFAELEAIRLRHGGILRAADVVEGARDPGHPLHEEFEWDDDKAAAAFRLWQARELIAVVVILEPQTQTEVRAYCSLQQDRKQAAGGYRATFEVLSDAALRLTLIAEALHDLKLWQRKYKQLKELAPIFAVAEDLQAEFVQGAEG